MKIEKSLKVSLTKLKRDDFFCLFVLLFFYLKKTSVYLGEDISFLMYSQIPGIFLNGGGMQKIPSNLSFGFF